MAFTELDQKLIDECTKDVLDLEKIKMLIADGADINAFDEEYEQALYEEILEYYIDKREEKPNLFNLYKITELFISHHLVLNHKPNDPDYFLPDLFKFLPPENVCVDIYKMLLNTNNFSFADLDNTIATNALDIHMGMFYFFEKTNYSKKDSLKYFLELIYWASAYQLRKYPEKCDEEMKAFDWFNRERNKIECIYQGRSTSIFIENLETKKRAEITGWTMKY